MSGEESMVKPEADGMAEQMIEVPLSRLELDDFIQSIIDKSLPSIVQDVSKKELEYANSLLPKAERKGKDASKILNSTIERVQKYLDKMREEEKELEEEIALQEKNFASSCEVIEDDSDDDVTFIGSSFDPNKAALAAKSNERQENAVRVTGGPTLANLREHFTNSLNSAMKQQSHQVQSLPDKPRIPEESLAQWPEIGVGFKVLAKKFNDIWYAGTVMDLTKPDNTKNAGEWKFRVKFDGKGMKALSGKHIAYRDPVNQGTLLKVGTRVTALYRDDESSAVSSFYAGIVAEAPSFKNQKRFLVFFDDGYAQYCWSKELHKVYYQSDNVWEDIHPDSQDFIKEYLKQYPERPMVRLMTGQIVRTEWNGRWWTAKVMEVDASLVKMYFQADQRTEWIYRGSTRLEPLFKALANAEMIRAAGSSRGRRPSAEQNKSGSQPAAEPARLLPADSEKEKKSKPARPATTPAPTPASAAAVDKKRPVARKSTTSPKEFKPPKGPRSVVAEETFPGTLEGWEAPWLKKMRGRQQPPLPAPPPPTQQKKATSGPKAFEASSISSNKQGLDMASVLQERLASAQDQTECVDDGEALGERMDTVIDMKGKLRRKFVPHMCCNQCVKEWEEEREKYVGKNPLLFPLLCGWERQIAKMRPGGRKCMMYRAPCGRCLRTLEEVDEFLALTDSWLNIDHFCFDAWLHVHTEFVPVKTFCDIKDLSYGKEKVPISCVNAIDRQYPDYVEYSSSRIPAKGVNIPLDDEFLQCCSCTDNCRVSQQRKRIIEKLIRRDFKDPDADICVINKNPIHFLFSCNDRSKCACQQLTIENTSWVGDTEPNAGYHHRRLLDPVFTGVVECNARCKCDNRCRNRVAQNGLSCRLQVFKTEKRGWGLRCLNDIPRGGFICIYAGQLLTDMGANNDGKQYGDEYLAELDFIEVVERQKEGYESDAEDIVNDNPEEDDEDQNDDDDDFDSGKEDAATSDSDFESSAGVESKVHATRTRRSAALKSKEEEAKRKGENLKMVLKRQSLDSKQWTRENRKLGDPSPSPAAIDDEEEEDDGDDDSRDLVREKKEEPMETDELPDLNKPILKKDEGTGKEKKESKKKGNAVAKTEGQTDPQSFVSGLPYHGGSEIAHRARKSTGGSRFKNLPNPKMPSSIQVAEEEKEKPRPGTRSHFKDSSSCYIMDAKSMGNIGRYLNHSCSPNVFVQNVFVDTHDLRFPWVAFFALQYIRAGTELTWDYNYEVGSVPDKVLYCYCGSSMCRGRLL